LRLWRKAAVAAAVTTGSRSSISTPCLKKLCKIVFVRTFSNCRWFWQVFTERWQRC